MKVDAAFDERQYGVPTVTYDTTPVIFDRVWPVLERSAKRVKTITKEYVWGRIESGASRLWTEGQSAGVTSFMMLPNGEKAILVWLAGGNLPEIVRSKSRIERYGRAHGCTKIIVEGRPGWAKALPDMSLDCIKLIKDI